VAEQKGLGAQLIGPIIIGVALLVGSFLVANAMNRITVQLDRTAAGVQDIKTALNTTLQQMAKAAQAQPAPQPARRRGPDPNKVHTVNIAGAAIKGPQTAKVKIVEFSDFQ
jgi:protein-disulfide isomerase